MKKEDFEKASLMDANINSIINDLDTLNRISNIYICGETGAFNKCVYLSSDDQKSVKELLKDIFKKRLEEYDKKFEEIGKEKA